VKWRRPHLNVKRRRVPGRCVRQTDAAVYRRRGPSTFCRQATNAAVYGRRGPPSLRPRGTNAVVYRRHGPPTAWSADVVLVPPSGSPPSWSLSFRRRGRRLSADDQSSSPKTLWSADDVCHSENSQRRNIDLLGLVCVLPFICLLFPNHTNHHYLNGWGLYGEFGYKCNPTRWLRITRQQV